jgi:hypothetical protein
LFAVNKQLMDVYTELICLLNYLLEHKYLISGKSSFSEPTLIISQYLLCIH